MAKTMTGRPHWDGSMRQGVIEVDSSPVLIELCGIAPEDLILERQCAADNLCTSQDESVWELYSPPCVTGNPLIFLIEPGSYRVPDSFSETGTISWRKLPGTFQHVINHTACPPPDASAIAEAIADALADIELQVAITQDSIDALAQAICDCIAEIIPPVVDGLDCDGAVTGVPGIPVVQQGVVDVRLCNASEDMELACGEDGELVVINLSVSPPTVTLVDGTPYVGAVSKCDVEYKSVESCWQSISDDSIRFTRVLCWPVDDPAAISTVWLDSAGSVLASAPADIESCNDGPIINTVALPPFCISVDGVAQVVVPILSVDPVASTAISTMYANLDGTLVSGVVSAANPEDCPGCSDGTTPLGVITDPSLLNT